MARRLGYLSRGQQVGGLNTARNIPRSWGSELAHIPPLWRHLISSGFGSKSCVSGSRSTPGEAMALPSDPGESLRDWP